MRSKQKKAPATIMRGWCRRCRTDTDWFAVEGWVFHTFTLHTRCVECRSATQPERYLPEGLLREVPTRATPLREDEEEYIDLE